MKNRFFASLILVVALVAMFSSCEKDTVTMTLYSQEFDNGGAKTSLDANFNVNWVNGDEVNINGTVGTITVNNNDNRAIIAGVTNATDFYVAYPAAYANTVTSSGIASYTMPSSYTYNATTTVCPMAGHTTDGVVVMKNLSGLLAITMNQDITVMSVSVSSPSVAFSGAGSIAFAEEEPAWTHTGAAGADTVVSMSFGGGLNMNGGRTFYLPVPNIPSGTVLMVRVQVNDNGTLKDYVKKRTTTVAIGKNQIAKMALNTGEMTLVDNGLGDVTVAAFTVNAQGKQVYFSKGNLQYNGDETDKWRFAPHQYDFIGADNVSSRQNGHGWVDLFAWGTSGCSYNGGTTYSPYYHSDPINQNSQYYAGEITGDYYPYDWGYAYSQQLGDNSHWRTLTESEWLYVINRPNHAAKATVCGVQGIILLPDGEWSCSEVSLALTLSGYTSNIITDAQWTILENKGAVCIPKTGRVGSAGYTLTEPEAQYWTATLKSTDLSRIFQITNTNISITDGSHYVANGVRLVKDKVD